jgi:hypothetical protein
MPSMTECKASLNGTYYSDDEVADLLGISLARSTAQQAVCGQAGTATH